MTSYIEHAVLAFKLFTGNSVIVPCRWVSPVL